MIEVFKTDVTDRSKAGMLVHLIHRAFPGYRANFDLQDCDHILRIKSETGLVEVHLLIRLLEDKGHQAELLPDEYHIQ